MEKEAKTEYILYCLDLISEQIYEDKLKYLSDSDWNEIIQLTMNHGITGLMYYATKTGHKQIPDQVMHKLKSIFLNITAKNMRIYSSLSKILEAFDNDNIHCIVMKGAALADQIYKDIGLRPMFDIDLLIDPDDIWKVNSVLSDLGYRSDINNFISNDHLKCANNIHYANNFTTIDVHPTLYNLPDTNPWERAVSVKISDKKALIFGPEDFIIHLCLHLNTHFYTRNLKLIWWFDIAKTLDHYQGILDWDYLMHAAEKAHKKEAVYGILSTVERHFNIIIPTNILSHFQSCDIYISPKEILDISQEPICKSYTRPGDVILRQIILFTLRIPSIKGKLCFVFRIMFPRREFIISHYSISNKNHSYLYYPLHLFNVIINAFRALAYIPGYFKNKQTFLEKIQDID